MASDTHDHSAIDAAENLIRESERLRAKLLEERQALVDRLSHVDRIVAALPRSADAKNGSAPSSVTSDESMPDLVRSIVAANPKGISVRHVLSAVRQTRPSADARLVHSALYRLSKSKRIKKSGRRGASIYLPTAVKQEASKPDKRESLPRTGAPGEALRKTAKLIAEQHEAVNSARLAELMDISPDAARVRLRRAKHWGLVKPGPVAGTFVAVQEGGPVG
jgi:hypothetical protein